MSAGFGNYETRRYERDLLRASIQGLYRSEWQERAEENPEAVRSRETLCGLPANLIVPETGGGSFVLDPSVLVSPLDDGGKVAKFGNTVRCGCVWTCPVCSFVVRTIRAGEIETAQKAWAAESGHCYMLTLTLSHARGDSLSALVECLCGRKTKKHPERKNGAWVRFLNSKLWKRKPSKRNPWPGFAVYMGGPLGRIGVIRALEVKYGKNGWHPHLHIMFFARRDLSPAELSCWESELASLWADCVATCGGFADLSHGCSLVKMDGEGSGRYLSKEVRAGFEIAGGQGKTAGASLNPFDLVDKGLAAASRRIALGVSESQGLALWWAFDKAFHGRHLLDWAPKLKAYFGIDEKSDEDAAEDEDAAADIVAYVESGLYRRELGPNRPERRADFLHRVAVGDMDGAAALIGAELDRSVFPTFTEPGTVHAPVDLLRVEVENEFMQWVLSDTDAVNPLEGCADSAQDSQLVLVE